MLYEDGKLNKDLVEIIKNCTRTPQYVEGDIQAQLGALRGGPRARCMRHRGASTAPTSSSRACARCSTTRSAMTAAAIERIPDGVYEAEDYVDTDGFSDEPVDVRVQPDRRGRPRSRSTSSGTDPQTRRARSTRPYANTASAVYYSLKFFLQPGRAAERRPVPADRPHRSPRERG